MRRNSATLDRLESAFQKTEQLFTSDDVSLPEDKEFLMLLLNLTKQISRQQTTSEPQLYNPNDMMATALESLTDLLPFMFHPLSIIPEIAGLHPITNFQNFIEEPARKLDPFNGRSRGSTFLIIDPTTFLYGILMTTLLHFAANPSTCDKTISLATYGIFKSYIAPRIQQLGTCFAERLYFYREMQKLAIHINNRALTPAQLTEKINELQSMLTEIGDEKMFRRSLPDAKQLDQQNSTIYENFVKLQMTYLAEMQQYVEYRDQQPDLPRHLQLLQQTAKTELMELEIRAKALITYLQTAHSDEQHTKAFIAALIKNIRELCEESLSARQAPDNAMIASSQTRLFARKPNNSALDPIAQQEEKLLKESVINTF